MISIDIEIIGGNELQVKLEQLPAKLHEAVREKITELTGALRLKVVENLSGKVLNSKSGALLSALRSHVEDSTNTISGIVGIESSDAKVRAYAEAFEYGGKGSYEIVPVHKRILRFVSKSGEVVYAPFVFHPPARERSYLRSALVEMIPEVERTINDAIAATL